MIKSWLEKTATYGGKCTFVEVYKDIYWWKVDPKSKIENVFICRWIDRQKEHLHYVLLKGKPLDQWKIIIDQGSKAFEKAAGKQSDHHVEVWKVRLGTGAIVPGLMHRIMASRWQCAGDH